MSAGKLRRALLFVPGDDRHKAEKATTVGADTVILDLEDGVAASRKADARAVVLSSLRDLDYRRTERLVRLNAISGPLWRDDLEATFAGQPDGYVVPKVEGADDVLVVDATLHELEQEAKLDHGSTRLLLLIETALGVVNLRDIATASQRVDALIFGAEDLAGDIGATRTAGGEEVAYARGAVVVHAKAFGLDAIDTPFVDLHDLDALRLEAEGARRMGYTGKLAIHPRQVDVIQPAFTPSAEEIARAQRLIDSFQAHQSTGVGVFDLDGKMVDMPMIRAAESILARARAAGLLN